MSLFLPNVLYLTPSARSIRKPLHASVYPSVSPQLHSVDITPAPLSQRSIAQSLSRPENNRCSFHDALFGTPGPNQGFQASLLRFTQNQSASLGHHLPRKELCPVHNTNP